MTYVYLIESVRFPQQHHVGITDDLKQRFATHNAGKPPHTRRFRPWQLLPYTAFASLTLVTAFEKYLKSGSGKAFLGRHFLSRVR